MEKYNVHNMSDFQTNLTGCNIPDIVRISGGMRCGKQVVHGRSAELNSNASIDITRLLVVRGRERASPGRDDSRCRDNVDEVCQLLPVGGVRRRQQMTELDT